MERMNGCRELDRRFAACLGFDGSIGSESDGLMQCVAIVCSMPLVGRPAFPFIGQGKARVTVKGKGENEKEKMSSKIVGSFSFTQVPPTL